MLLIKAFHLMAMVAWFSGLFYLPRLFVYHADARDRMGIVRFKRMEARLYYGIIWPAALMTTGFGLWLLSYNESYYLHAAWMHAKLGLVGLVWVYQLACGHFMRNFRKNRNARSAFFFRVFNEMPTLLLAGIVVLAVVKPY